MRSENRKRPSSAEGFALVTALMACAILFALAMLILQLSTGDLKVSAMNVGNKKASIAAEAGVHLLLSTYDPSAVSTTLFNQWYSVDGGADPNSRYRISTPATSQQPPVPLPGYSIDASQGWGLARFDVRVEGQNTLYNTSMDVDVGMGYGPVPTGTLYR